MRWFDLYVGLLGATMAFAATVIWTSEGPDGLVWAFLAASVAFIGLAAARARRTPRIVVVGEEPSRAPGRLDMTLDDAGYAVVSCAGPHDRPCPVEEGLPCPYAGAHPVAVIVAMDDSSPTPPCERGLRAPVVRVAEGRAPEDVLAVLRSSAVTT